MDNELKLKTIQSQVDKLEKSIEKEVKEKFIQYDYPDRMPPDWGRNKLKLTIPYDFITVENLDKFFENLKKYITSRKILRKQEGDLMLSMEVIKISETIPE